MIVIAVCACLYFFVFKEEVDNFLLGLKDPSDSAHSGGADLVDGDLKEISSADLSIHFIAPALKASGDCTLIKVGDTEVLIDAGPTQGNVTEIKDYLSDYCTDGVIEDVIATHADTVHIAGLVGNSVQGAYNGILYSYKIGTIIQFDHGQDKEKETAVWNRRYMHAIAQRWNM